MTTYFPNQGIQSIWDLVYLQELYIKMQSVEMCVYVYASVREEDRDRNIETGKQKEQALETAS